MMTVARCRAPIEPVSAWALAAAMAAAVKNTALPFTLSPAGFVPVTGRPRPPRTDLDRPAPSVRKAPQPAKNSLVVHHPHAIAHLQSMVGQQFIRPKNELAELLPLPGRCSAKLCLSRQGSAARHLEIGASRSLVSAACAKEAMSAACQRRIRKGLECGRVDRPIGKKACPLQSG